MTVYWDSSAVVCELWTTDQNDFEGLGKIPLKYLADIPAT